MDWSSFDNALRLSCKSLQTESTLSDDALISTPIQIDDNLKRGLVINQVQEKVQNILNMIKETKRTYSPQSQSEHGSIDIDTMEIKDSLDTLDEYFQSFLANYSNILARFRQAENPNSLQIYMDYHKDVEKLLVISHQANADRQNLKELMTWVDDWANENKDIPKVHSSSKEVALLLSTLESQFSHLERVTSNRRKSHLC